jgi:hypothetical protein
VPESKGRAKATYTPPQRKAKAAQVGNPAWFAPVMVALLVLGLLWIVTFYVTQGSYPVPSIGYWNLAIGITLILGGFGFAMRWR